jgi:hypothetical protein
MFDIKFIEFDIEIDMPAIFWTILFPKRREEKNYSYYTTTFPNNCRTFKILNSSNQDKNQTNSKHKSSPA